MSVQRLTPSDSIKNYHTEPALLRLASQSPAYLQDKWLSFVFAMWNSGNTKFVLLGAFGFQLVGAAIPNAELIGFARGLFG